jgi:outer membrane protein assembly factor BamB
MGYIAPLNMKHTSFIYLCLIVCLLSVTSCAKTKKKIVGNYIDVSNEMEEIKPDPSMSNIGVSVPNARKNTHWSSSNGIPAGVPDNIHIRSNLQTSHSYSLRSSSGPDVNRMPVIQNEMLYVLGDESTLYAYNLDNLNKVVWKQRVSNSDQDVFGGGIATSANKIAVTCGDRDVTLLDASTGKEVWRHPLSNISRVAPLIHQNLVLVLTVDNKLYAIDINHGTLRWMHEEAGEEFAVMGGASPRADNDVVVVPYSSGQIGGFDIKSGQSRWLMSLPNEHVQKFLNSVCVTPVIRDGTIFTSDCAGTLFAVNATDGRVLWVKRGASGISIWVSGDYIYSINKDQQLVAIYRDTGAIKWIHDMTSKAGTPRFSGPIMINSQLYVASSDGVLTVIAPKTGKKISEVKIKVDDYSNPVVVNDKMYLLSSSGRLLVVE